MLIIGGDGSVHQFLNSVVTEGDGDHEDLKAFMATFPPLVIAPAGSSNGLACSLGAGTLAGAIENLLWGEKIKGKVALVEFVDHHSGKKRRILDPHIVSWGITAEHDLYQEVKLRNRFFNKAMRGLIAPLIVMLQAKHIMVEAHVKLAELTPENRSAEERVGQFFTPCPNVVGKELVLNRRVHSIFLCGQAYGDITGRACPGASPSDGGFHALVFFQQGVLRLLHTFFLIHTGGRHLEKSAINARYKLSAITVKPAATENTDETMSHLLSLSGELYWFRDGFSATVLADSISFLVKDGKATL